MATGLVTGTLSWRFFTGGYFGISVRAFSPRRATEISNTVTDPYSERPQRRRNSEAVRQ